MSFLRTIAKTLVPKPVRHRLRSLLDSDYRQRQEWARDAYYGRLVFGYTGGIVLGGPFKGLKYVDVGQGSTIGPKLLGTYEKENTPFITEAIQRGYRTVINVGAGEGYYGIGLAKAMPAANVICYDGWDKNQEQIRKLAELNSVASRVQVKGFCTADTLNADLTQAGGDTLVVMDVEGAEMEILQPNAAPALLHTTLLVELHDIIKKGMSAEIQRRFASSHRIEVAWTTPRTDADWPAGLSIPHHEWADCMSESRGGKMSWFWMYPKSA